MSDKSKTKNVLILFGATGHLARTRLIDPILDNENIDEVIAIGRSVLNIADYCKLIKKNIDSNFKNQVSNDKHVQYIRYDALHNEPNEIIQALFKILTVSKINKLVFYVAVHTANAKLMSKLTEAISRIVSVTHEDIKEIICAVEKPVGNSMDTAIEVLGDFSFIEKSNANISDKFKTVYIDHYLSKYMVYKLENKFRKTVINDIVVNITETGGVEEGRKELWDVSSGIFGDIIQNHILNTVACVCGTRIRNLSFHIDSYTPRFTEGFKYPTGAKIVMYVNLGRKIDVPDIQTKLTIIADKYGSLKESYIKVNGEKFIINSHKCNAYITIIDMLFSRSFDIAFLPIFLSTVAPHDIIAAWKICDSIIGKV